MNAYFVFQICNQYYLLYSLRLFRPKSIDQHRLHLSPSSSSHQIIEERSQRKKVDQLETSHEAKSQQQTQQASEWGQYSEPILCCIFAVECRNKVVEVDMDEALIFENNVFAVAIRVEEKRDELKLQSIVWWWKFSLQKRHGIKRVISIQAASRYLRQILQ